LRGGQESEAERAVRDASAEARARAERFVEMDGVVVAGDARELGDVALGDGPDVLGAFADTEAREGADGGVHAR
jgi:hypothetical protein